MKLKHYLHLFQGKIKTIKQAKITPRNVLAVVQAWFRQSKQMAGFSLPDHIYEQIIWRRVQVALLSPECWRAGYCKVCGCDILGKTMEDRACSAEEIGKAPCYPAMMTRKQWTKYKIDNDIKLFE